MDLKTTLKTALLLLFISSVGVTTTASAQGLMSDFMGRPVFEKRYTDTKGTPYLFDGYENGAVKLQSGKSFSGVKLRYDQVEDELMFLNESGKEMLFAEPVTEFTINDRTFRRGYPATDGATAEAYYEVLVEGKTELLKRTSKKIIEEAAYNAATKVKSIRANENYYVTASHLSLTKVKKDKKSLLAALPGKSAELETYVKDNRLDLRQEQDMAKLVIYYNSL